MEETNWFYNSWLKLGLVLELNRHLDNRADDVATVMWWKDGEDRKINACYVSKLEVISESR
jgi:hypothetical protein